MNAAQQATMKAQSLDAKYHIKDKTTKLVQAGLQKASSVNAKYQLTDKATAVAVSGLNATAKALK
jgi:hypothetical protein